MSAVGFIKKKIDWYLEYGVTSWNTCGGRPSRSYFIPLDFWVVSTILEPERHQDNATVNYFNSSSKKPRCLPFLRNFNVIIKCVYYPPGVKLFSYLFFFSQRTHIGRCFLFVTVREAKKFGNVGCQITVCRFVDQLPEVDLDRYTAKFGAASSVALLEGIFNVAPFIDKLGWGLIRRRFCTLSLSRCFVGHWEENKFFFLNLS